MIPELLVRLSSARPRAGLFGAALGLLSGLGPLAAQSLAAESAAALLVAEHRPDELLVGFRDGLAEPARRAVLEDLRVESSEARPALGYHRVVLPAGTDLVRVLTRLQDDPDVAWVEPNFVFYTFAGTSPQDPYVKNTPASPNQYGVFSTHLQSLWRWAGGADPSVVIGIVDSGIDSWGSPHADLAANVLNGAGQGRDFVDDDFTPTDVGAFRGHGTSVASVAAASANALGTAGVAYDANLRIVRVMDCSSSGCPGDTDDIASGIQWAADQGVEVINLSLGGPAYSQALRNAVLYAIAKDALVVAASGNDGVGTLPYPAAFPEVITVGATDATGDVWADSNWGDELDLVAPGAGIWCAKAGGGWHEKNGTSFAAPFVSGVVAILAHRYPDLTQTEAEKWLESHAEATPSPAKDGAGHLRFAPPSDWSDSPGVLPALHENFAWEWLGRDATGEKSEMDPGDSDGVPNIDGGNPGAADLADDGVFPANNGKLPLAPTRWAPPKSFDVELHVSDHLGPRYGATPDSMLHLDMWIDWDANGTFDMTPSPEHAIVGHTEDPGTWGGDVHAYSQVLPVTTGHIYAAPLRFRTRLGFGLAQSPDGAVKFGEVEDDHVFQLVEDFDMGYWGASPFPFLDMGTWFLVADPDPLFTNHGMWEMARAAHPRPFEECTGVVEHVEVMKTPPMFWPEYTGAAVSFVYSHESNSCGPFSIEACRVEVKVGGSVVLTSPIPLTDGSMTIDLSSYTGGTDPVEVAWIVDTDNQGHLIIDDVTLVALDEKPVAPITDLAASRPAGSKAVTLSWTAPAENLGVAPPKESVASAYQIRYAPAPIVGEMEWNRAQPVRPSEAAGGALPVPGAPGSGASLLFDTPSAFGPLHFAVRTGDEVVQLSALSNVPMVGTVPTLATAVAAPGDSSGAPGDSLELPFTVSNGGDTPDILRLDGSGAPAGWDVWFNEDGDKHAGPVSVLLDGGTGTPVTVGIRISPAASDSTVEYLRLLAISTTDTTKTGIDSCAVLALADPTGAPVVRGPSKLALRLVGPNPFRGTTAFELALPTPRRARLAVYDVAGRRVRTLLDRVADAGAHRIEWDGRGEQGEIVPSGIYFLQAQTDDWSRSVRIVRMR